MKSKHHLQRARVECAALEGRRCTTHADCKCAGMRRCQQGKCQSKKTPRLQGLSLLFFLPYFHRTVPSWFDRPRSAVFLELFFSHKFCQHLNLTGLLATHSTGYRCFKSSWRASFSLSGFENALQIRNQCRPLARRIAREMGHFAYDSARRHRIGSFRCHSARPRLS